MKRQTFILTIIILFISTYAQAKEIKNIPNNYMAGLTDYFYEFKIAGIKEDGTKSWSTYTDDRSVRLAVIGDIKNPEYLIILLSPSDTDTARRNDKALSQLLKNVIPLMKNPSEWLNKAIHECIPKKKIETFGDLTISMEHAPISDFYKIVIIKKDN